MGSKIQRKQQEQVVPEHAVESDTTPAFQQAYGNAAQMERLEKTCTEPRSGKDVVGGLNSFRGLVSTGLSLATGGFPAFGLAKAGMNLFGAAQRQSECAPHVTRPQQGLNYDQQHDAATERALNGQPEPDHQLLEYLDCLDSSQSSDPGPACQKEVYGQ